MTATQENSVVSTYMAGDRKTKARMLADMKSAVQAHVRNSDFAEAQRVQADIDAIMAATKAGTKTPVDYAQQVADLKATLQAALNVIETGGLNLPEGVEVDFANLPEGEAGDYAKLLRITTRKATREGVIPFIEEALEGTTGWVTVSQLAKFDGCTFRDTAPSTGALGAAIARVADGAEADFVVGTDEKGRVAVRVA
jgi:hypothetical protein